MPPLYAGYLSTASTPVLDANKTNNRTGQTKGGNMINNDTVIASPNVRNSINKGKRYPNIILAGYFNLPSIDWEHRDISSPTKYGLEVNETVLEVADDLYHSSKS